jgi:xylulokinase
MGVDSSTQSTKALVVDADSGAAVAGESFPHPPTTPPRSEQDPESWWTALNKVRDSLPPVDAIAVAAQQHGLVVLDADDHVIRPAKLWNDTEAAADSDWLRSKLDDTGWARACGSVPLAAFTIAKLSWLHRKEPDVWAQIARVCLPHDWLTWKLTGEFVTDRGDASGTGYFSAADNEYRFDLLDILDGGVDWAARVPRVVASSEARGTGDNMAAALGIGLAPGDVAISIGTSGTVYAVSETPTFDGSGAVAGFADATGRFLPLVCTLNATKVTDAIGRVLGVDHERLDALALDESPGAGGVTLVPYFDGERTPNRPDATGALVGLRSHVTREQLARAAYEGVVCGLLDGLDALAAAGVDTTGRLVLVGGGARSRAFREILAAVSGRAVTVPDGDEHAASGAAVLAAAALHGRPPEQIAAAWELGHGPIIEPVSNVDRDEIRTRYHAAAR